tara:strand:- start:297 stop:440 length:144 start_codon:yes stop_codon:yes gene_type:complete
MDRYAMLAVIASALLSFFAFVEANDKTEVEYIIFEEPIVITANLENL